jgi:outer membrane protein OmpA-like peptidoglycan-associated protein
VVGVAGFTDNRGGYAYNQKLSKQRAMSVASVLGASSTKGCAYAKAIAPNDSAANMALNRRVEVYLFKDASNMQDPCN